jgi:signal transduction histidine kinase
LAAAQLLLAAGIGVCLALAGALALLLYRQARASDALRHSLQGAVLWWWRADAGARVCAAEAGRRRPDWLVAGALAGRAFWNPPGCTLERPPAAIEQALAQRRPFFDVPIALEADAPDGTVLLSGVPLFGPMGRFQGYAGTATRPPEDQGGGGAALPVDVAERIARLESERQEQARRFTLAAREMESFSYSVSHDLRAPLRVVDGFANIILEDYGPKLDELGREHVKRIAAAASRMNAMIDALLAMSRRTGRELEVESVDLSRIARELADELRAGDFGRSVEFRIEPDIRIQGDPVLLRLVLQNLMGNAFKFSAHAPQARIEFGHRPVSGEDVLYVRDNGAGFDMRFAERLFGLFQRFHSQNEFPGTGVGLATVQRIVRKHGGRVWAESEPGKGACFYFTIPPLSAGSN